MADAKMHDEFELIAAARAGNPRPSLIPLKPEPNLTSNKETGYNAARLEQVAQGVPDPMEVAVAASIEWYEHERERGLFHGESLFGSYSAKHIAAGVSILDTVKRLRAQRDTPRRRYLQSLAQGWLDFAAGLALAFRGKTGIVRGVGMRYKHGAADQEGNVRGGDVLAWWYEPAGDTPAGVHPFLYERLSNWRHSYWSRNPHELFLHQLLVGTNPAISPTTTGRLRDRVYYRRDPLHIVAPALRALLDSDGERVETEELTEWRDGVYLKELGKGPFAVQKGVSACWEQREDDAGRLVESVHLRHIQGVQRGEVLPHPDERKRPAPPSGAFHGWNSNGPDSEPFPLPELEERPGPEPEPVHGSVDYVDAATAALARWRHTRRPRLLSEAIEALTAAHPLNVEELKAAKGDQ